MISACSMRDSVSELPSALLFIRTPLEVVGAIKLLVAMLVEQWLLVKLEMVMSMLARKLIASMRRRGTYTKPPSAPVVKKRFWGRQACQCD